MASRAADSARTVNSVPLSPVWRAALIRLALAWAVILLVFARDAADMAKIWWDSSTFNHILLIPFILGWLVMQRAQELKAIAPSLWWPGLLVMAAAAAGWVLGEAAGVSLARHLALVLFLQGSTLALLGPHVGRALTFPLAYAFFLVPVGEELVPPLQTITADISMLLLGWTGIPAHIEGVFISTPTALFRVAEACSGVKFLIAMIAYGVLVANVCFSSWPRRFGIVALSIVVPILANGVRAFGTIYIAHLHGLDFAAGFDHVFYGWIFFALVLILVMAIGWRFFDRQVTDPFIDPSVARRLAEQSRTVVRQDRAVVAGAALLVAAPLGWALLGVPDPAELPRRETLPHIRGWQQIVYAPATPWTPRADGSNRRLIATYQKGRQRVDVYAALFDGQSEGREITGYGQGALDPDGRWSWVEQGPGLTGGRADVITGPGRVVRDVATFYRVGDMVTGSNLDVRVESLKARLLGQSQPAMILIVSAERIGDASARPSIDALVRDAGGPQQLSDMILAGR
ncbi:exosortase A [Blastomonas natatoria]|uniref:Exosortase A n=1 Tax=Blastomonas natatoria TaxID=34015 RepID=A0A2V3VEG7_9SPHN|nr:exosortase A [Blastomonas natatoria]PXW78465.1 exosortase A [Blastomonas natatoria]